MSSISDPDDNQSSMSFVRRGLGRLGTHELGFLLTIAGLLAGLWAFALIAEEVKEGATAALDRQILLAMRNPSNPADPLGPPVVEEAARDITALGGAVIIGLLTVVVGVYLVLDRKGRMAAYICLSVLTGMLASTGLKFFFNRPRPELVPHAVRVVYSSFPSGHSMVSAVAYLTIGALLARSEPRKLLKAFHLLVAVVLTVAIGISRVYLGVHWPSDVLAGWTAGVIWALLCWNLALFLQRSRTIETSSGDPGREFRE